MVWWGDTAKLVQWKDGGLEFDLPAWGDEPVDLVVASLPRLTSPESALPLDPPREVLMVGNHEGFLANVRPGQTGLLIHLQPVRTAGLTVRALDLADRPTADVHVRLESRADWIDGKTDSTGEAVFHDVPIRTWRVRTEPPQADRSRAVSGRTDVVPADQVVDVPLRRAVAIRLRAKESVSPDAFLMYGDARGHRRQFWGWKPEADGGVLLPADPEWSAVEVWMVRHVPDEHGRDSEILTKFTVPVREGATAEFDLPK